MRKTIVVVASVALAVGMLFSGFYAGTANDLSKAQAQTVGTTSTQPNIVFILTDDMRKDDLKYMPKTKNLLQKEGMTFRNAFVSNALCCPSRATIMRGQYSHNTGVWSNATETGGWQAYRENGDEADNVATRLDDAGYRTALFGKYLNGYTDTTAYIPRGWDRWFATQQGYFDYYVNDQGTIKHFGTKDSDYQTDVISRKTNAFISKSGSLGEPFFAYVAPKAPHSPFIPAPRDAHTYDGIDGPRLPSFNEKDVSDKPPSIQELPRLTSDKIAAIDKRHENRVETLQAVDDLVQGVVRTLNNANAINNTYIFFTSDNGWHHGEHRLPKGKSRAYEEDIHMPLLVRGPGVAASSTTPRLILNTDYLPTFTHLACSSIICDTTNWSYTPDGRSLSPVLKGNQTTWRSAILLENAHAARYGIRTIGTSTTTERKYVEYGDGARELYNLASDPYELINRYAADAPPSVLASRLAELKGCTGDGCRAAENGP